MTTSIKSRALTDEDQKLFFEALCEYGKDFQSIQQYMSQRSGQRNNSANVGGNSNNTNSNNNTKISDNHERKDLDKKEDDERRKQIRNFYNKLYTKLSGLIGKIDDSVEKVNQELYLLINYGEIWKSFRRDCLKFTSKTKHSKTKKLLEELVYQGTTTFRYEKKNVRLRTPSCKALKKINEIGIDEKVKVVTTKELPKDVIVEFHPATNRDWLRVQSLSQNPRVRARLSMQKRLTNILDYLETKWDVSQNKLNRNVDVLLKVSSNTLQTLENGTTPNASNQTNGHSNQQNFPQIQANSDHSQNTNSVLQRIRLKPSNHHELKEVNITRVVPDNHLDLSLTAYIKRCKSSLPKNGVDVANKNQQAHQEVKCDNFEFSSVTSNASRLPVSLTTPDCSILLERSCTSDQPSIAQARKHLNILQSLTGALEGCENSRTAYEDTQDRSLMNSIINHNSRSVSFAINEPNVMSIGHEHIPMHTNPTIHTNGEIPALYDEDAALPVSSSAPNTIRCDISSNGDHQPPILASFDCHNSKSVDFGQLPKDVTLGDYINKMNAVHNEHSLIGLGGDEAANDAFPIEVDRSNEECDAKEIDKESDEQFLDARTKDTGLVKTQSHMIEIKKFADGWTKQDEPALTLGELYLAFKCPEKLILEYEFEQYEYCPHQHSENDVEDISFRTLDQDRTRVIRENTFEPILLFKLLTAANLSLAKIEKEKAEQQQTCSKLKRRKGSGQCQGQTMTLYDIERNNQQVEEQLKQLQPTRLCSYRKAR